MNKRITIGLVLLCMAALLTGCAAAGEPSVTTTTAKKTTTTTPTAATSTAATTTSTTAATTTEGTKAGTTTPATEPTGTTSTQKQDDGVLAILMIGNSYSVDAIHYAWDIAQELGYKDVRLGNMFIGGCSLNTHMSNITGNSPAYVYYRNNNGRWLSTNNVSLETALADQPWDVVTLQQASVDSGIKGSYNKLYGVVRYVAEKAPQADLVWHMTWAYAKSYTYQGFVENYDRNQQLMYQSIVSCVKEQVLNNEYLKKPFAKVIPNGTAIQNARTSYLGDSFNSDGTHLSDPVGRYVAALTLVHTVTGKDISQISYAPDGVTARQKKVAIESAINAVKTPFEVTPSAYT